MIQLERIEIVQGNYISHEAEVKKLKIKTIEMIIVNLYVLKLNNKLQEVKSKKSGKEQMKQMSWVQPYFSNFIQCNLSHKIL